MARVFVGHDWAEAHHDVFVEDEAGRKLGGGRLSEGVEGVARFHAKAARTGQRPVPYTGLDLGFLGGGGRI
jgi:hypothetical protein